MEVKMEIGNIHTVHLPEGQEIEDWQVQSDILRHFEEFPETVKGSVIIVFERPDLNNPVACGICCPDCGEWSFKTTPGTDYNQITKTVTLHPSIVLHCCGYHGFLENNLYRKC